MARWPQFTIASLLVATFWCAVLALIAARFPLESELEWWLAGPLIGLVGGFVAACFTSYRVVAIAICFGIGVAVQGATVALTLYLFSGIP
jgi:hypothetical protein